MLYSINVSIIIPHYNSPKLLAKLLQSIPEKEDIQIIVVDDNSTKEVDILEDLMRNYNSRVEFYTNDTHIQSAGACRNIGLKHAKGKWLLFADADDFFLDGMYETISPYFNTDNDIVFFTPTSIFIDTAEVADRHRNYERLVISYIKEFSVDNDFKIRTRWWVPYSKLIRKEIVDTNDILFSTSLHGNDIVFSAKVGFYAKKISVDTKVIYCITRSRGSLTTIESEEAYFIRLNERIKEYSFIWSHYDKKLCSKMHVTGARFIYEILFVKKMGINNAMKAIRLFHKAKVPVFTIDNLKLSYILRGVKNFKLISREKKKEESYIVRER